MSIYTYLHTEHEEVKAIMASIADMGDEDSTEKFSAFSELKEKLLTHAKAEETVFYDELKGFPELADKIDHAEHEHEEAETLLEELSDSSLRGSAWQQKFLKLKNDVEHHIEEEEKDVFKLAKERLYSEGSEVLEEDMKEAEKELLAS